MVGFRWAQCRRVRPVLWDYASERLSEGPMETVEQHLQTCGACRDEVVAARRAQQFLSACRACEEPAPRSDWNALRQRMVAEGVTPVFEPASLSYAEGRDAGRRGLRASWQMQLLTSTAGGFAAVLMLGAFYTLRLAPASTPPVPLVSSGMSAKRTSREQAAARPPVKLAELPRHEADGKRLIDSVVSALADTRALPDAVPAFSPVRPMPTASISREQAHVNRVAPENGASNSMIASVGRLRGVGLRERSARLARNTASRTDGKLHLKPYTPKPQERLQEVARATDGASRYALERVRPVNTESDESGSYVVGSVRSVSYDESGDF